MGYKDVQGMKTIRDAANLAMGLVAQQSRAAAQAAAVKQGRQAAFNSTLARDRVPQSVLPATTTRTRTLVVMDDVTSPPPGGDIESVASTSASTSFLDDPLEDATESKLTFISGQS